jgi:hypothetical protein
MHGSATPLAVDALEAQRECLDPYPGVDHGTGFDHSVTRLAEMDGVDDRPLRQPAGSSTEPAGAAGEQPQHVEGRKPRQLTSRPSAREDLGNRLCESLGRRSRFRETIASRTWGSGRDPASRRRSSQLDHRVRVSRARRAGRGRCDGSLQVRARRFGERAALVRRDVGQRGALGSMDRAQCRRIVPPLRISATYGGIRELTRRNGKVHPSRAVNGEGCALTARAKVTRRRGWEGARWPGRQAPQGTWCSPR